MASDSGPKPGPAHEDRSAGGARANAGLERVKDLAGWWAGWWRRRTGYAGMAVPAALALVYWILFGWPALLLGAGLGIVACLLWSTKKKAGKIAGATIAALPALPLILFVAVWVAPVIALIAAIAVLLGTKRQERTGHYHARWAAPSETRDMRMPVSGDDEANGAEGVLLGEHGGEVVGIYPGFEGRREMGHVLVGGPSRSGKGLHLITNLLHWPGSAVVNDIKGELYGTTAAWREERLGSKVKVLDPSGRGDRYDPFYELSYRPEALMSAAELIMSPNEDRQPIFGQRAMSGLYAAALAARREGAPALPYIHELTEEGPEEFVKRLDSLADREVRRSLVEFIGGKPESLPAEHYHSDRFFTSAWSNLTTKLRPFFSEGVLKMTGGSDFEAADLVRENSTLYLRFAESELRYTKKVYQVMLQALISGLIRHGDINPERADEVPLLLALDEAGRTPIPELDDLVSTISGRGMSALIYVQDLSQLESSYDRERAKAIRSNCHTQLFYRPMEPDTAAYISRMSGQTSVEDVSVSKSRDPRPHFANESRRWRERELITEDEARQVSEETVFVFTGKKPPIRARRLKWFELMPEAARFAEDHPPAEPEELPAPQRRWSEEESRDERGTPEDPEEPQGEASPNSPTSPNGGRRRRRGSSGSGGERAEGGYVDYVEPDV